MQENKPKWSKPKLIVLLRGKKEEITLAECKYSTQLLGPSAEFNACYVRGRTCGTHTCYLVMNS